MGGTEQTLYESMTDGKVELDGENGVSRTAVSSGGHVCCRSNMTNITACYGPISPPLSASGGAVS